MKVDSLLNRLPAQVRSSLMGKYPVRRVSSGEVVHRSGDVADRVLIVLSGSIQGRRNGEATTPQIMCQTGHGETLGLCCALGSKRFACQAVAQGPSELLDLPLPAFQELLDHHPSFRDAVLEETMRRLKGSISSTMENRGSVDSRLRAAVKRLMEQQGQEIHATRRELASMAGTTVESAIRTVRKWEQLGWVTTFWKGLQVVKVRPFLPRRTPKAGSCAVKRRAA